MLGRLRPVQEGVAGEALVIQLRVDSTRRLTPAVVVAEADMTTEVVQVATVARALPSSDIHLVP